MGDSGATRTQVPGMWPPDADVTAEGPADPRTRAISIFWAAWLSDRGPVRKFRTEQLGGGPLKPQDVDSWIKSQPESKQRRTARWLCNIPMDHLLRIQDGSYIIPADVMEKIGEHVPDDDEAPRREGRWLLYATPEREEARVPIPVAGGILDTLRSLGRYLVKQEMHGLWKEAQAVTYVLTGYAPLVSERAFPLPSRSGRRQTEKHLQLAAFTAQEVMDGLPLAGRLAEWNRRFPHWAYKNTTNFGWDSRQAVRRLLLTAGQESDEVRDTAWGVLVGFREPGTATTEQEPQQGNEDKVRRWAAAYEPSTKAEERAPQQGNRDDDADVVMTEDEAEGRKG
jgi:hypothetical protein